MAIFPLESSPALAQKRRTTMGKEQNGFFFDDEPSGDWLEDFLEDPSESQITETLIKASGPSRRSFRSLASKILPLPKGGYLHSSTASQALVAAELAATLLDQPASNLPDRVRAVLKTHVIIPQPDWPQTAIRAVEQVRDHSRLRDLWEQTDEFEDWMVKVEFLLTRLRRKN